MWAVTHDFEFSFSIGDRLKVSGRNWPVFFENNLKGDYNTIKEYFPRLVAGFYPEKFSDFQNLFESASKRIEKCLQDTRPKNVNEELRGPYSFLFFLTAFDLALERKGEFKENNAEALMDMIELLLEMADYPESYVKVNNE